MTRQEQQVFLFLATIALIGIGVNFVAKQCSFAKDAARFTEDIGKIDLNTADKRLLMSVSGIGTKLSQRIVEYREAKGRFGNIEELKSIKGITETKYEKMKDKFIVR